MRSERRIPSLWVITGFLALGLIATGFADFSLAGHDPWQALTRMGAGFLRPDFSAVDDIGRALLMTVAFAICGVAVGATAGLILSPFYYAKPIRFFCIYVRSVHELFWALMLMQGLGIGPLTGVLAIALPYTGIFAKVFAEHLDETDPRPARVLPPRVDALSRFLFARAPLAMGSMWSYTLYRLECGLRSSAVLGFIGLPTLGFQLDSFFKQGNYGAASAVLICYVALIASIRIWMRLKLALLWLVGAITVLSLQSAPPMGQGALWRFLTSDIIPAPIRNDRGLPALWDWLTNLTMDQILPGLWNTIIVGQIALVLMGALAFVGFGLPIRRVTGRIGSTLGYGLLVVLRSLPEYMLAYLFLQIFGPSMLPAVLALSLHNGAIIAHLLSRDAAALPLRSDAPHGITLWGWEFAPRLTGTFLALCLYRWEIVLRETAVMGLLGIPTLGFFVDAAIAELRVDRALILLVACAAMTATVDIASTRLRRATRTRHTTDIRKSAC